MRGYTFHMFTMGFKNYLVIFLKYFIGYFLLVFCILILVFNGRAMIAQARWNIGQWISQERPTASPPPFTPTSTQAVDPELRAMIKTVPFTESETYIVIEKIRTIAPVVFPDSLDNVVLLKSLEKGVIKYKDSTQIGEPGTAILLGHSSAYPWYRGEYGSVFALLEKLENGDQFALTTKNGKTFYYRVDRKQIIIPKDFKIDIKDGQSHIVLISCWPVRSNKMRMTVWSDLIKVE